MGTGAPEANLGYRIFGVSALVYGAVALIWHTYHAPSLLGAVGIVAVVLHYAADAALVAGGAAIQIRASARAGAAALTAGYVVLSVLTVPRIISAPGTYFSWGDFFYQFSTLTGAGLAYAWWSPKWTAETIARAGRILSGIYVVSFTLEQAFYLKATASFVEKWIPPSPRFWAIATTVFFALGALALLANQMALLAARLLTIMVVGFGLLVWVPRVVGDPRSQTNWSEISLNFAIAGALWILAELLAETQRGGNRPRTA